MTESHKANWVNKPMQHSVIIVVVINKNFQMKSYIFSYSFPKHRSSVLVRTTTQAILTSTHKLHLCFREKMRKITYTTVSFIIVKPSFKKWGLRGLSCMGVLA